MDSILVASASERPKSIAAPNLTSGQRSLAPVDFRPKGCILEKRPTFEALDKRKSWSMVDNTYSIPMTSSPVKSVTSVASSRISAYQNTHGLVVTSQSNNNNCNNRTKKPVPLPRSKIPVVTPSVVSQPQKFSSVASNNVTANRLFKRSKTDLCLDSIETYKTNRKPKYPAPKVPSFISQTHSSRPVPTKRTIAKPEEIKDEVELKPDSSSNDKPDLYTGFKHDNDDDDNKSLSPSDHLISPSSASKNHNLVITQPAGSIIIKSEPLMITTELLNDNHDLKNVDDEMCFDPTGCDVTLDDAMKSSCSSSFDSVNDTSMVELLYNEDSKTMHNNDDTNSSCQIKSPISTVSRSPPSPSPGMTPTRQVYHLLPTKFQTFNHSCF